MQNSQEVWLKGLELYFYLLLILSDLAGVSLAHKGVPVPCGEDWHYLGEGV